MSSTPPDPVPLDPSDASAWRGLAASSGAAVRQALETLLLRVEPAPALNALEASGALVAVLPEVAALAALAPEPDHPHKDLWAHTVEVVARCPPRPVLRWAALLHDIGKVDTRQRLPDGRVAFHGHAEAGALRFRSDVSPRLAFPEAQDRAIHQLILLHQRPGAYADDWQDAAVRRLARDVGEHLEDLLDLGRADVTSQRAGRREEAEARMAALAVRTATLRAMDERPPTLPAGLGDHLMAALGLAPGPAVGVLRQRLAAAVERGDLLAGQTSAYYLEALRDGRA
jgi:poly(A) polymerase